MVICVVVGVDDIAMLLALDAVSSVSAVLYVTVSVNVWPNIVVAIVKQNDSIMLRSFMLLMFLSVVEVVIDSDVMLFLRNRFD